MYSDKSGCILAKDVVFPPKLLYSGKSRCYRVKFVFGQSGCIWAKIVEIRLNGCIRAKLFFSAKWLYSGISGCIRAMWLYLGKVMVFSQRLL